MKSHNSSLSSCLLPFLVQIVLLLCCAHSITHLHPGPAVRAGAAFVSGHYLRHVSRASSAVQFEVEYRRPLLFWDELSEDGVSLRPVTPSIPGVPFALRLSGAALDTTDFVVHGLVLFISKNVLLSHNVSSSILPDASTSSSSQKHPFIEGVALSVKHVHIENEHHTDSTVKTRSVTIHTLPISANSAVSHVRFVYRIAKIHPQAHPALRRRFHVYGRHSRIGSTRHSRIGTDLSSSSSSSSLQNDIIEARQLSIPGALPPGITTDHPVIACFLSATGDDSGLLPLLQILGFEPVTFCELELVGEVLRESLSTTSSGASSASSLSMQSFTAGVTASASLDFTTFLHAYGAFNVTSDTLNFTLNYHGYVSAEYDCPGGCSLEEKEGVWVVPEFHNLVATPDDDAFGVPPHPGTRVESDLVVLWGLSFHTMANASVRFTQDFNVSTSVYPNREPLLWSVPSPRDVTVSVDTLPAGSESTKLVGPSGFFDAAVTSRASFRDTGTVIKSRLDFTTGFSIKSSGSFATPIRPASFIPSDAVDPACSAGCHAQRVRIRPSLRNMSLVFTSTDTGLGWDDIDTGVQVAPTGSGKTFCFLPTPC